MNNMEYSKPAMKYVSLRGDRAVADVCWGTHAKDTRYYDTAGAGFLEFWIASTSCDLTNLVVMFHDKKNDELPEQLSTSDPRYIDLKGKLESAGGSQGQNFKGMNNNPDFPDNPGDLS